jgi:hypothetical protein
MPSVLMKIFITGSMVATPDAYDAPTPMAHTILKSTLQRYGHKPRNNRHHACMRNPFPSQR